MFLNNDVPLSLSDSIQSRKEHQSGMSLKQLTNSEGHALSTNSPEKRMADTIQQLCQDAKSIKIKTESVQGMTDVHRSLLEVTDTTDKIKRVRSNIDQLGLASDDVRTEQNAAYLAQEVLSSKGDDVHIKINKSKRNIFTRIYSATLGKGALENLKAQSHQIIERQSNLNDSYLKLDNKRTSLIEKRKVSESALEGLFTQRDNFVANSLFYIKQSSDFKKYIPSTNRLDDASDVKELTSKVKLALHTCTAQLDGALAASETLHLFARHLDSGKDMLLLTKNHRVHQVCSNNRLK
jgi:hypothetical protein